MIGVPIESEPDPTHSALSPPQLGRSDIRVDSRPLYVQPRETEKG